MTSPSPRSRRPPIRLHHASKLTAADRAQRENVPVTSVARTLLDQAALLEERRLRRLLRRSEERELFDLVAVRDVLDRNRGHRGCRPLRRALVLYEPVPFTRSEFELRVYEALLAAGLAAPRANFSVAGMELDLFWPEQRFAVELDTYGTHGTHEAFERDRERAEDLLVHGIAMTRVTDVRFAREPDAVLARLRTLLAERGPV